MKKFASLILLLGMVGTVIAFGAIPALAKDDFSDSNSDTPITADIPADDKKGSVLSEGSLAIIVGVSAAVVFGFGGFFIGRKTKRKPESANE